MGCSPDNELWYEEEKTKTTDGCQIKPANITPGQGPEKYEVDERCRYPTTESMGVILKGEVQ